LLEALAVPFCKDNDCRLVWYKKGSGAALDFLKAGRCDVIMVHAPVAEQRAVAEGWACDRTLIGANRFFIVGPQDDPAGIVKAQSVPEAYQRIARARARFYSRGDNSGTHKRELAIWRLAGITPTGDWYVVTHAFMGPTLLQADRQPGYFMTDNSTYYVKQAQLKHLVPLFEGDPLLNNVYHALRPNAEKYPGRANALARRFIAFVASPAGQAIIRNFGKQKYGRPLYRDAAAAVRPAGAEPAGKLVIFHAGSLSVPMAGIEKAFEARYPKVDVLREAAGSQKCARKISELKRPCDIMAAADYKVIDKLLIPEYAVWNVKFASNRMVLCYTDQSTFAGKLTAENWFEILADSQVSWGHADPNVDPCGYRSLMVLQLAENYYQKPGLAARLLKNRPLRNVRPKSVELISLLETGNLDYAWEYRSVAIQHHLRYLELPAEINLGDYCFDELYQKAAVEVSGKKPGTKMTIRGKSITYGITLLKKAPNREAAIAFLAFLLDPQGGLAILKKCGQPPLLPPRVASQEALSELPEPLQKLVKVSP
jgi:molybdate/tungstate transport system substrate-binding protein